jgi:NAD(P)-dependent dehydrogenase (short-subunit alcohol dehydrogenase family)
MCDEHRADVRSSGVQALAIRADNADPAAARAAVDTAASEFGRLDILVNNAGMGMFKHISQMSDKDLDTHLHVNLRGTDVASQQAVKYLPAGGRIIMIGSINADRIPGPGRNRLRHGAGRPQRLHPSAGPRPRAQRHHHQHRATGPDRHRRQPRRSRLRRLAAPAAPTATPTTSQRSSRSWPARRRSTSLAPT